jgi:Domain of unknown function (DUF1707)
MAVSGEEISDGAGGHGHLRASHADREQVIGVLKAAYVQGRLTKGELEARVGQAFAARTYGELAAVTADLPPGLITAPPLRQPARAPTRLPVSKVVAGAVLVIPAPAMVAAAFITGSDPLGKVAILTVFVSFMAWIAAGMQLIANWHDNRSRGQLPPRSAQGGQALERGQDGKPGGQAPRRLPSAELGGQLPPVDPGHRRTVEVARRSLPRPLLLVRGHCAGGALAAGDSSGPLWLRPRAEDFLCVPGRDTELLKPRIGDY